MQPKWALHLKDPEEKKRFISYLYNSKGVLDRLHDITRDMEAELESSEISESGYESPSWAYKQADTNGYRRCLRHIQKYLTLDQRKDNG